VTADQPARRAARYVSNCPWRARRAKSLPSTSERATRQRLEKKI
jgi:hypothetical protein